MLRPVALSANGTLLNPVYVLLPPVAVAVYELRIRIMHVLLAMGKLFAVTGPLIAEGTIKGLRNFFNGAVTKEAVSSGCILLWIHVPPS